MSTILVYLHGVETNVFTLLATLAVSLPYLENAGNVSRLLLETSYRVACFLGWLFKILRKVILFSQWWMFLVLFHSLGAAKGT